ncbi:hypothetical protein HBH98_182330 [Parastagonospora nodorum]|nr:hypothetical protein HBH98_182330 [Parastagonospora nodorum]KAH5084611.1 hypothetical protein HBI73_155360 [Parastagonospora nodorum]KAH5099183.1 hypothetical protein HBH71_235900 [Parastagonospora nodorum]KAH5555302.1 hypothetical protein HBI26_227060 [Parastagonospora nodorum]KAH5995014.1 hypothetical protein HBI83_242990 [Parastagonospora nodorum]
MKFKLNGGSHSLRSTLVLCEKVHVLDCWPSYSSVESHLKPCHHSVRRSSCREPTRNIVPEVTFKRTGGWTL